MKKQNNVTERPDPIDYTNFLVYPPILKDEYNYVLELYCDNLESLMEDRLANNYDVNNIVELRKLRVKYARLLDIFRSTTDDMNRIVNKEL